MKIAIDIDDTICNTMNCDFNFGYLYNKSLKINDNKLYIQNENIVAKTFGFTDEQEHEFFMQQKKYIMRNNSMYPLFFSPEVINRLGSEGYEIVILTARNSIFWNGNAKKWAKKWLRKNGIKYASLVTDINDKSKYCLENDISLLIEDSVEHISKANIDGIKTIMLSQPYNVNYFHKLNKTASCWAEIYFLITNKIFKP